MQEEGAFSFMTPKVPLCVLRAGGWVFPLGLEPSPGSCFFGPVPCALQASPPMSLSMLMFSWYHWCVRRSPIPVYPDFGQWRDSPGFWVSEEQEVQFVPVCPMQLSHDANETLPLHLYVKSFGKNIDSKLQGRWSLGKVGEGTERPLMTRSPPQ